MADTWNEERAERLLKSVDSVAQSLKRIASALEGDPAKPILPRIASAIERMADNGER